MIYYKIYIGKSNLQLVSVVSFLRYDGHHELLHVVVHDGHYN